MSRKGTKRVILLNADENFLCFIHWRKAIRQIYNGKMIAVKNSTKKLSEDLYIPLVVKMVKLIRTFYKSSVKYNRKNILIRDNFTCQYCGTKDGKMTVDHIIPRSRGGKNSFDNTICCCLSCNSIKANKLPSEAGMYLKNSNQPRKPTIMEFFLIKAKNMNIYDLLCDYGVY